jgi:hypothetical protein
MGRRVIRVSLALANLSLLFALVEFAPRTFSGIAVAPGEDRMRANVNGSIRVRATIRIR